MKLKSLNLVNFKNYVEVDFNFSDKINFFLVIMVGKTNILDSIHYLVSKSYFNHIDSLNIKYGELFFQSILNFNK